MELTPEIAYGIGVVLLGLGIAYGVYRYKMRDKRLDPLTEAKTRELYTQPTTKDDFAPEPEDPAARA